MKRCEQTKTERFIAIKFTTRSQLSKSNRLLFSAVCGNIEA